MKIVVVPDSCDLGTSSSQKGKLFESFTKDVLLKHNCQVERVQFVPKDADVWAFEIVSKTPVMIECKAGETPVKKEEVASFYGDFKLAQGERPNIVGILMATSGFTAQTADSARAYYEKIPEAEESFFLYDSIDMISLPAGEFEAFRVVRTATASSLQLRTQQWFTDVGIVRMEHDFTSTQDVQDPAGNIIDEDGLIVQETTLMILENSTIR